MRLVWLLILLATCVLAQTDYTSCDTACVGVYDSTCDLAQSGLSGCVTCSQQFVNLDKTACRDCLISLGNATIVSDFDFLEAACPNELPSSGLSTGAKVGIAIGAVIVVVALAAGLFVFLRRRKGTGTKRKSTYEAELSGNLNELEEQQKGLVTQTKPIRYLDPDAMNELAGGRTNDHY